MIVSNYSGYDSLMGFSIYDIVDRCLSDEAKQKFGILHIAVRDTDGSLLFFSKTMHFKTTVEEVYTLVNANARNITADRVVADKKFAYVGETKQDVVVISAMIEEARTVMRDILGITNFKCISTAVEAKGLGFTSETSFYVLESIKDRKVYETIMEVLTRRGLAPEQVMDMTE